MGELRDGESEVIYHDRRSIRGRIVEQTESYIVIERDDGRHTISRDQIIRIMEPPKKERE